MFSFVEVRFFFVVGKSLLRFGEKNLGIVLFIWFVRWFGMLLILIEGGNFNDFNKLV